MHKINKNIPLKDFSNYKIGGPAKYFAEVSSYKELIEILNQVQNDNFRVQGDKVFVLGGGTNVLISNKGFDGLVIYNKIKGTERRENNLKVGSGVLMEDILNYCIENSLSGLEWAGGLPGTIGGAVYGNAGAFAGEIKDHVLEVESIDFRTREIKKRSAKDCKFSYRNSVFKKGDGEGELIISVILKLLPGKKDEVASKISEKIEYRNNKHPLNFPNIGSIFKNIPFESLTSKLKEEFGQYVKNDPFPVVPTAKIIALSGIKGKRIGGAMVSDKHTNFIVNVDNATSADVRNLITLVKQVIKDKYRIDLEEEIVYLKSV